MYSQLEARDAQESHCADDHREAILCSVMMPFRFEPELFDHRTTAMEALAEEGFDWFSDFSSVDLLHDVFGMEVCGIAKEDDALNIESILHRVFPTWKYSRLGYKDGERDPGWKVVIHRDPETEPGLYSEA